MITVDLMARDRNDLPVALIEARNGTEFDESEARRIRRYLLQGMRPTAAYMLVASQDRGFLWLPTADVDAPPDEEIPLAHVVKRYVRDLNGERLTNATFILVLIPWLSKLALGRVDSEDPAEGVLARLGFVDYLHGASLEPDVRL